MFPYLSLILVISRLSILISSLKLYVTQNKLLAEKIFTIIAASYGPGKYFSIIPFLCCSYH
jgi:hypothetical protein